MESIFVRVGLAVVAAAALALLAFVALRGDRSDSAAEPRGGGLGAPSDATLVGGGEEEVPPARQVAAVDADDVTVADGQTVAREIEDAVEPRTVLVEVFDHTGAPAPGIPVALCAAHGLLLFAVDTATSDAEGRARLTIPKEWFGQRHVLPAAVVTARAPMSAARSAPVDVDASHDTVVRLDLPAFAHVVVTVTDGFGNAVDGARVLVREGGAGRRAATDPSSVEVATVVGEARFERVEAGLAVDVVVLESAGSGQLERLVRAPDAGETLRVAFAFDPSDVVITGRLAGLSPGEHGASAGREWSFQRVERARGTVRLPLRIAPDGAFAIRIDAKSFADIAEPALIAIAHDLRWRATVPLVGALDGRVIDVGELDARSREPYFAGTVEAVGGGDVGASGFTVEWHDAVSDSWSRAPYGEFAVSVGRRFQWHAPPLEPRRFRFTVYGGGTVVSPDFVVGPASNLRIVLDGVEAFRGRVVLPDEFSGEFAHDVLEVAAVPRGMNGPEHWTHVGDEGWFSIDRKVGPFDLLARPTWTTRPLTRWSDTGAGQAGEPLLFDLRNVARRLVLELVDAEGRPIGGFARDPHAWTTGYGLPRARSRVVLVTDGAPIDVDVWAPDRRRVELRGITADQVVRLDQVGLRLELRLARAPELGSDVRAYPVLLPADIDLETSDYGEPGPTGPFDAEGLSRVVVPAPGRFRVVLQLERAVGRGIQRAYFGVREAHGSPVWIDVADRDDEQRIALDFDVDALRAFAAAAF